jgi:hypothetical protein
MGIRGSILKERRLGVKEVGVKKMGGGWKWLKVVSGG